MLQMHIDDAFSQAKELAIGQIDAELEDVSPSVGMRNK